MCRLFRDYLKERKCEENLYFWLEVELFHNPSLTPDESLVEQAVKIYEKFMLPDSPFPVNIDSELLENIEQKIQR